MPIAAAIAPIAGGVLGMFGSKMGAGGISDAQKKAQQDIKDAVATGKTGVTDALGTGKGYVDTALANANTGLTTAGDKSISTVNDATTNANKGLADMLADQKKVLDPYLASGATANDLLMKRATDPNSQFKFNYDDYKNDPAFQFEMDQGKNAINNSFSARGLGSSGNALKELTKYGTGLAATHYNEAFNRANTAFNTNTNATMENLKALLGAGEFGTSQYNDVTKFAGGKTSDNIRDAGYFAGNTGLSIAQLLANMGIQTSEFNAGQGNQAAQFNANLGLNGALGGGKLGVDAANTNAAGNMGFFNNLASTIGGIANLWKPKVSMGPGAGPGLDRLPALTGLPA
jgi:hypothetical protein